MKVSHKLSRALSFVLPFHPDGNKVFKVVTKALKKGLKENRRALKEVFHLASPEKIAPPPPSEQIQQSPSLATLPIEVKEPLKNELTEKIERLFTAIVTLELLIACYTPWDVPEDSIAYPLFSYGTKILHLEGIFHILASERPSDVRYILAQPLFVAARVTRLVARSLHLSVVLHEKLTRKTREEHDNTLVRVEEAQREQIDLIREAKERAEEQKSLLASRASSDTVNGLQTLAARLRTQMAALNEKLISLRSPE